MFEFIDRHKVGILTTIVIHLMIITVFMVVQFSATKRIKEKQQVIIDFVDQEQLQKQLEKEILEKQTEIKKIAQQELSKDMRSNLRNIAINETEKEAVKSVDDMVKDIKGELNIKERTVVKQEASTQSNENKAEIQTATKQEFTTNEKGERSIKKGNTTLSYFLDGRMHIYMPIPVYQCEASGKVFVDIVVNADGFVISATVNKTESQITDNCLIEAAKRAAFTSRFQSKNLPKQSGKISYTFIAQ